MSERSSAIRAELQQIERRENVRILLALGLIETATRKDELEHGH
jgi:hypothetical protein